MAGEILGMLGNVAGSIINNALNRRNTIEMMDKSYSQQRALMLAQYGMNEKFYRTYQSPEAMLKQIKEAGLSPSLMYANGASSGGGSSLSSPSAPSGSVPNANFSFGALEAMQAHAQIKLMEAEAKKTEAETNVIDTTGIDQANATIAEKLASAGEKKASTQLIKVNTELQGIEAKFAEAFKTKNFELLEKQMDKIQHENELLLEEIRSAKVQAEIDERTKEEAIKQRQNECTQSLKNLNLTDAQIESLYNQINTNIQRVSIEKYNARTMSSRLWAEVKQWQTQNKISMEGIETGQENAWISAVSHILGTVVMAGTLYATKNPMTAVAAGSAATQATQAAVPWFIKQ